MYIFNLENSHPSNIALMLYIYYLFLEAVLCTLSSLKCSFMTQISLAE